MGLIYTWHLPLLVLHIFSDDELNPRISVWSQLNLLCSSQAVRVSKVLYMKVLHIVLQEEFFIIKIQNADIMYYFTDSQRLNMALPNKSLTILLSVTHYLAQCFNIFMSCLGALVSTAVSLILMLNERTHSDYDQPAGGSIHTWEEMKLYPEMHCSLDSLLLCTTNSHQGRWCPSHKKV